MSFNKPNGPAPVRKFRSSACDRWPGYVLGGHDVIGSGGDGRGQGLITRGGIGATLAEVVDPYLNYVPPALLTGVGAGVEDRG